MRIHRWIPLALALSFLPRTGFSTTAGAVSELTATGMNIAQRAPSIDWDGTQYVLVWEDSRNTLSGVDLYVARLMSNGALVDPMGISVLDQTSRTGNQLEPQIAYNALAGTHMIVWTDS